MTKHDFFIELRTRLSGLAESDVRQSLDFYEEMIADRMEEGMSEEEAVAAIGSPEEIARQIIGEMPLGKLVRERIRPKRPMRAWEIVLLALGSPIWLSLLIVAFSVVLSLYVSLWAVIVSLWAGFGAIVGSAAGGLLGGIGMFLSGHTLVGLALVSAGLVCAGLSIFAFYGCLYATRGILLLTRLLAVGMKRCFMKKEVAA